MRFDTEAMSSDAHIRKVLNIVRTHLDMDVGFVAEFVDGKRVFRHVDGDQSPVAPGDSGLLEDSYCQRVVDGRLPELMTDACDNAEALTISATRELPVGAHMSVPLRLPDGRVFGTFCCFSFLANPSLNARDLRILRAFAAIVADLIHEELDAQRELKQKRERIEKVIANQAFHVRYQPIYRLNDETVAGFEALARFEAEPYRSPDKWFAEADEVGLGEELEIALARKALEALSEFPKDVLLSVNFSPATIMTSSFAQLFATLPLDRVVLEVTEHAAVANYTELSARLHPFRLRGLLLAVDDAGAGHSSFRHVLDLRPDTIKLDMSLTRNIDRDRGRQALASALSMFGRAMGSQIVAEGVESEAELDALRRVGVTKVQGYLTGRPMPLADAVQLVGVKSKALRKRA
ncbi:MAG: EAL domain-containing protein [Alphaproteobacteria bacterium]|nr:MAG: EAL domain-containing protein [Alphaproteobacteria bacterium]